MTLQTVGFAPATLSAIAHVGQVVTVQLPYSDPWQGVVHSVEGHDWYAFDLDGVTTVDCNMTPASWITEPRAMVIPAGHKIGDGYAVDMPLRVVRRGVCLAKAYR